MKITTLITILAAVCCGTLMLSSAEGNERLAVQPVHLGGAGGGCWDPANLWKRQQLLTIDYEPTYEGHDIWSTYEVPAGEAWVIFRVGVGGSGRVSELSAGGFHFRNEPYGDDELKPDPYIVLRAGDTYEVRRNSHAWQSLRLWVYRYAAHELADPTQ